MAYQEYLPSKSRGRTFILFTLYWSVGSNLCILLSWAVIPTLGWRWLVLFSTIPLFTFMVSSHFIPDTPMYLCEAGKEEECLQVLRTVS